MGKNDYENAVASVKKHRLIHQYTTFEALEKILCNKSLRLTRVDQLNDNVENDRMLDLWKEKVYVSCFTHRSNESYFFWKTYARKSDEGIRVSLRTHDLYELSVHADEYCDTEPLHECKITNMSCQYVPEVTSKDWGIFDYSLVDVKYLSRNKMCSFDEHFQGRFKYKEWDDERETRLRVAIRPKCFEASIARDQIVYLKPTNQYLYVHLPDRALKNMSITLTPFADCSLRPKVEMLLQKCGLIEKVKINNSVLENEVS